MTTFLTEPRYGIRYPAPGASLPDYEAYIQALADDVGTKTTGYSSGLTSAIPAAGVEGRWYRQTDGLKLLFDNGTAWQTVMLAGAWVPINLSLVANTSAAAGYSTPATRLVGDTVQFHGAIEYTGSGTPFHLITLGAPFIPAVTKGPISCYSDNGAASMAVYNSGLVNITNGPGNGQNLYLDGISFPLT